MPEPTLPPLPTPPSSGFLVIFSPAQWTYVVQAFQAIHTDNEAVAEALGPLTATLETLLMSMSDLTTQVADLKANVADLAMRVSSEIGDLAAAVARSGQTDPAVADAVQALQETNTELTALSARLAADDQAAPAAPTV